MNAIINALANAGYAKAIKVQKEQASKFSGWSANLSYKTYQALKNQGVMQ